MNKKATILAVVIGLAVVLGVVLRSSNRADAAGGNCYSDTKGPSEPTLCN